MARRNENIGKPAGGSAKKKKAMATAGGIIGG